jgi:hypothetical protein
VGRLGAPARWLLPVGLALLVASVDRRERDATELLVLVAAAAGLLGCL